MRILSIFSQDIALDFQNLNLIDLIEIRHDEGKLDFQNLKKLAKPLIYTRHFAKKRLVNDCFLALKNGFSYVDCDYFWFIQEERLLNLPSEKLILSLHVANIALAKATLDDLLNLALQIKPYFLKLAFYEDDPILVLEFLNYFNSLNIQTKKCLSVMGLGGEFLRILYKDFKQDFAYMGYIKQTAPYQVSLAKFIAEGYINKALKNLAIIGKPISHSLSPKTHNQLFKAKGLDLQMVRLEVTSLKKLLLVNNLSFLGFAITMPLKEEAQIITNSQTPINTLILKDDQVLGFNTDILALQAMLLKIDLTKINKILLIGAGSLAKAFIPILLELNLKIIITNRTKSKAISLAKEYNLEVLDYLAPINLDNTLIIQASACGMLDPKQVPCALESLHKSSFVIESVYKNGLTQLLLEAQARGVAFFSGEDFFMLQAKLQNELFIKYLC